VARWVEKGFGFERRHALAQAGGASREVYGELAGLGLTGLAVPEAHGGLGFGPVEAMVVMEELGRGLVNAPYVQGALVAPALLAQGPQALQSAWLPRVADGSALVVLAHQERAARWRLNHVRTRARWAPTAWRLDGVKCVVPAGRRGRCLHRAGAHLRHRRRRGRHRLFLVERQAAQVRAYPTQDGARAGEVRFDGAAATLITPTAIQRSKPRSTSASRPTAPRRWA
jgi:alkylation response protein AidB-like acyl-CoA dehydrogenase